MREGGRTTTISFGLSIDQRVHQFWPVNTSFHGAAVCSFDGEEVIDELAHALVKQGPEEHGHYYLWDKQRKKPTHIRLAKTICGFRSRSVVPRPVAEDLGQCL